MLHAFCLPFFILIYSVVLVLDRAFSFIFASFLTDFKLAARSHDLWIPVI